MKLTETIDIEWARPLGTVHVVRALWEELGLAEILRGLERRPPDPPSCSGEHASV